MQLDFARPGEPTDISHIKSFNGRLCDEFLNVQQLFSLDDARAGLEAWRRDFHEHRPHSSLGHVPTRKAVIQRQVQRT